MKKQRGVGLSGLIIVLILVMMVALLGFKLFPPYLQYFSIKKTFKEMSVDPELRNASRRDFMGSWARYATIDNITAIGGDDIDIAKDGDSLVISAAYTVKVPLFSNISLLIDFAPTSAGH